MSTSSDRDFFIGGVEVREDNGEDLDRKVGKYRLGDLSSASLPLITDLFDISRVS